MGKSIGKKYRARYWNAVMLSLCLFFDWPYPKAKKQAEELRNELDTKMGVIYHESPIYVASWVTGEDYNRIPGEEVIYGLAEDFWRDYGEYRIQKRKPIVR